MYFSILIENVWIEVDKLVDDKPLLVSCVYRNYFTATLMYRCIYEQAPIRLINELVMIANSHERNTRSAAHLKVKIPKPNVELFRNSLRYRGALLWNSLPSDLKTATNVDVFKYRYKKLFFNKRGSLQ